MQYRNSFAYKSNLFDCLVMSTIEESTNSLFWVNLDNPEESYRVQDNIEAGFHFDSLLVISQNNEVYINQTGKTIFIPAAYKIIEIKPNLKNTNSFYLTKQDITFNNLFTLEYDLNGNRIAKY